MLKNNSGIAQLGLIIIVAIVIVIAVYLLVINNNSEQILEDDTDHEAVESRASTYELAKKTGFHYVCESVEKEAFTGETNFFDVEIIGNDARAKRISSQSGAISGNIETLTRIGSTGYIVEAGNFGKYKFYDIAKVKEAVIKEGNRLGMSVDAYIDSSGNLNDGNFAVIPADNDHCLRAEDFTITPPSGTGTDITNFVIKGFLDDMQQT